MNTNLRGAEVFLPKAALASSSDESIPVAVIVYSNISGFFGTPIV